MALSCPKVCDCVRSRFSAALVCVSLRNVRHSPMIGEDLRCFRRPARYATHQGVCCTVEPTECGGEPSLHQRAVCPPVSACGVEQPAKVDVRSYRVCFQPARKVFPGLYRSFLSNTVSWTRRVDNPVRCPGHYLYSGVYDRSPPTTLKPSQLQAAFASPDVARQ